MNIRENDITLSLVVPVRNEAATLDDFCGALMVEADKLGEPAEVIFVNDGSSDDTETVLHRLQIDNDNVRVVDLSRRFGRAAAVTAGVEAAGGKAVVTFDRRCENWPEVLARLIVNWREGFEIVHAVGEHPSRESAKACSCIAARILFGRDRSDQCGADMRLIDRRAAGALRTPGGVGLTVDERIAELGFRQTTVAHQGKVLDEQDGPPKATRACGVEGGRLLCGLLAGGGLLLIAAVLGAAGSLVAAALGVGPPGWVWLMFALVALVGLQLVSLPLVGSYIARAAGQADHRPLYVVRDMSGFGDQQSVESADESARSGYVVYT